MVPQARQVQVAGNVAMYSCPRVKRTCRWPERSLFECRNDMVGTTCLVQCSRRDQPMRLRLAASAIVVGTSAATPPPLPAELLLTLVDSKINWPAVPSAPA